jgi:hypothetical protein
MGSREQLGFGRERGKRTGVKKYLRERIYCYVMISSMGKWFFSFTNL